MDQALLAAGAESGQADVTGDLAQGAAGDVVWVGRGEGFPSSRGGVEESRVGGLFGQGKGERDEGVGDERGGAVAADARSATVLGQVAKRGEGIGPGS